MARKTKIQLRSEKHNSPEAVAARYGGGLVKNPQPPKPSVARRPRKQLELSGNMCPFCTSDTNFHREDCPLGKTGGMEISSSLKDTLESRSDG